MTTPQQRHADLPPPSASIGALGWLRKNLFDSPLNGALTLLALYFLYRAVPPLVEWAMINADWRGTRSADCSRAGACWVFIHVRLNQFMYGFYPVAQQWRVNLAIALLGALIVPLFFKRFALKRWLVVVLLVVYPIVAFYLLVGGRFGLTHVETSEWGGLSLTLVIAIVGMVAALPLGIVLALGRRATHMPVLKALCVAFIELVRGVPLITVLFMSSVMLPFFLPEGLDFDKLLRALIGVVLFASAYMAEVVRGGLQGIPRGQFEAAASLGLGFWKSTALVILPQALKLVIPGIVNTFIGLFKDTSLVLIIGLFDLLGSIQAANADPNWLGFSTEGYVFAGCIYWAFCFSMSRYSQWLEKKLQTGYRRR
ncbi:amino acid ABC transporter permease [Paraburkholderia kirstenboschensis]|uniref:Amino acid ABC transporter permease n=1 Tax=Paraburkholderia kirstenboschensis TaxID=1245436 RepID=A0ABZ0E8V7_9BURK|nr:amino acid ABC transporter permease [Paraburkholderia kirstenboschensis]WOD13410.1 amino acid ABC transporter permease [Paraburkholderia kirstenboschensis]